MKLKDKSLTIWIWNPSRPYQKEPIKECTFWSSFIHNTVPTRQTVLKCYTKHLFFEKKKQKQREMVDNANFRCTTCLCNNPEHQNGRRFAVELYRSSLSAWNHDLQQYWSWSVLNSCRTPFFYKHSTRWKYLGFVLKSDKISRNAAV